jgi:hypothetical protein
MNRHRWLGLGCLLTFAACIAVAQGKPSSADQKRTIRVGVALTQNRSGRSALPIWERDQLVRYLQRVKTDRKSPVVLEVVPLEASSQEDAGAEATKKNCRYFVLTTMVDPSRGPGISGGPDGIARSPVMIGNAPPERTLALEFSILDASDLRTVADGTYMAPVEDNNDTRAADEAIQMTAGRVASELRKDRAPNID